MFTVSDFTRDNSNMYLKHLNSQCVKDWLISFLYFNSSYLIRKLEFPKFQEVRKSHFPSPTPDSWSWCASQVRRPTPALAAPPWVSTMVVHHAQPSPAASVSSGIGRRWRLLCHSSVFLWALGNLYRACGLALGVVLSRGLMQPCYHEPFSWLLGFLSHFLPSFDFIFDYWKIW